MLHYLEGTLDRLITTQPSCLLLPATWAQHGALLQTLSERRSRPQLTLAVERLEQRNNRLLRSPKNVTLASGTPHGRVYGILDSVNYHSAVSIDDLSSECMEVIEDDVQRIAVLMHWACSSYREGIHRAYLATRLLRKWNHQGSDVYEGIVSYLQEMTWKDTGEVSILFKIIAELVRSKTFSIGRYLQWLIATGSLRNDVHLSQVRFLFPFSSKLF